MYTPLRRFWIRLLVQSMSCIGVLSLLSSNMVLAQTEIPDAVVVPTKTESKSPAVPVGKPNTSQTTPVPVRVERLRQKLAPTFPVERQRPRLKVATPPTPRLSVPRVRVAQPPTNSPSLPAQPTRSEKAATNYTVNYNGTYIDPTEYRLGATRGYEVPSAVVLSERSTGCKAILRQGQVSGSCGTRQQRTRVATRGTQSINTVDSIRPRSQAPSLARSTAFAVRRIAPIRVGSISASGFHSTRRTSAFQGQGASVKVPTRSVTYYNRGLRPTGQLSANVELMFPLTVPAPITSLFGWRIHPITGNRRFHAGTDFGASLGTPVLAAAAGKVAIADFLGGYGLAVVLEHNEFTQQTLYGHLSEIFVQSGEWIDQGTVIGRVGSTGNSTGPHLHFETRQLTPAGWVATDPGIQLEDALAQLVESLRADRATQEPGT